MRGEPNEVLSAIGGFHPLLVQAPLGGLLLLASLELLSGFSRWKNAAQNRHWILILVTGFSCLSTVSDWLLGRWNGLVLLICCLLCFILLRSQKLVAYRACLVASLVLLLSTGQWGGSLALGSGFVSNYRWRGTGGPQAGLTAAQAASPQLVFEAVIQPILRRHCVTCHGPDKHKAHLRLDTLRNLLRGGENGSVVKAGHAQESPLFQRIVSPLDADGHMPPEGESQPSKDETETLRRWLDEGTGWAGSEAQVPPSSDTEPGRDAQR